MKLFTTWNRKKVITTIIVVSLFVVTISIVFLTVDYTNPENVKKREIKEVIKQEIGDISFTVDEIIAESQGWYLAKITVQSSGDKNYNQSSMAILKDEGGKKVIKLGPGTSFEDADLDKAGVPDAIYNREKKFTVDPITKYLPYRTNDFSLQIYPSKIDVVGTTDNKKPLDLLIYEFTRTDIHATPERRAKAKSDAIIWMQSVGLNPDNYELVDRGAYEGHDH